MSAIAISFSFSLSREQVTDLRGLLIGAMDATEDRVVQAQCRKLIVVCESALEAHGTTRWRCTRCRRDRFTRRGPHRCGSNYRTRGLTWEFVEA